MAETDHHRELMFDLIKTLQARYAGDPMVYVSGNLLVFYVPGNRRRHLAPDVLVTKGVAKRERLNYLVWEEGKGPDLVIELTSSSTRREDVEHKFRLYQDTLRVSEYFLFDPFGDYLQPPLQGYRLRRGKYVPIKPVKGRLPSKVLGLHLEQHGSDLRLFDPATGQWLPTPLERIAQAELARQQAEAENERLRRELEELRRRLPKGP
jgi:Uma2 family endonuclease